jgi:MFS family permease
LYFRLIVLLGVFLRVANHKPFSRVAISIYFFVSGLIFSSWASRIPNIKDRYKLNEAELGGLLFMLPMGALLALPFAGWLVHRFGSKRMSLFSLLVYSLLLVAIALNMNIFWFSGVLFLFGVLGNLCNISMNAQGLSIQEALNKPILSGLHAMWSLGAFSAAAITGLLEHTSLILHYFIISSAAFFAALFFSLFMVRDLQHSEGEQKIFALPNRRLMLLGIICFCVAMTEGAMSDWSSLYYRQVLHQLASSSTAGYTSFAFCMALGRFTGDRFIHAFGHSRVLKMNGLLIAMGMSLSLLVQHPVWVIIGFALIGFGVSSVIPIVYMLAAKSKAMPPAVALSAVSSVGFTGFLVGPPIIGFIAQALGLRTSLVLIVFLGLMIWLLSFKARVHTQLNEGSNG